MKENRLRMLFAMAAVILIIGTVAAAYFSGYIEKGNYYFGNSEPGDNQESDQGNGNRTHETDNETDNTNSTEPEKRFKDIKVKAVYYTGPKVGDSSIINHIIELANTTEINAVVIDVKEGGRVNYESQVPMVKDNKLYTKYYNPEEILKKLHENNIYVIGRIVCFRDDGLASKRADLAIKRLDGSIWKEGKLGAWTNPYYEEVWQYNIDIAKEAISLGFDEIQFDYVRFPTTKRNEVYYGENMPPRPDTINSFLAAAKNEIGEVPVSADIFGIVIESISDGKAIGQDLDSVGQDIDCICPMIYPSHYANASNGMMGNGHGQEINGILFQIPDLDPYGVVYNTLFKAKERISALTAYKAKVRPYLQDFTATYLPKGYYQQYGAKQVREQINAVYDAGYEEWILWNGVNKYSEDAFEKE